MKTNIQIELSNEQRNRLKVALDGKHSKKLLSRAEVVKLAQDFFEALLEVEFAAPARSVKGQTAEVRSIYEHPFYKIAPGDEEQLAGKPLGYIYGWNKARASKK